MTKSPDEKRNGATIKNEEVSFTHVYNQTPSVQFYNQLISSIYFHNQYNFTNNHSNSTLPLFQKQNKKQWLIPFQHLSAFTTNQIPSKVLSTFIMGLPVKTNHRRREREVWQTTLDQLNKFSPAHFYNQSNATSPQL